MNTQSQAMPVSSSVESATWWSRAKTHLDEPKVRFLDNSDEKLMIALPWIGVILAVGFWAIARFGFEWEVTDLHQFLFSVVFMDAVHIMFTLVMLFSLPELRTWRTSDRTREKSGWMKGMLPTTRFVVVGAVLGTVFYIIKTNPMTSAIRGMATIYLMFEIVGPCQHTIAQMKGISLCFNGSIRRQTQFNDAEKAMAMRCESLERLFFKTLLIGEIMYWIPQIFELDKFDIPNIDSIQSIGGIMMLLSAQAILVNALYFPKQEESRKFAYLVRVLLFPLKMLSIIGGLFVRAAHGTEYLIVMKRMVQGSKIDKPKMTRIYLVTAALSALYLIPFLLTTPEVLEGTFGIKALDALLGGALLGAFILRFTHYYMDAVVFKMGDPATREIVSPLLIAVPPTFAEANEGGSRGKRSKLRQSESKAAS